jgi:hypothetical protein
MRGGALRQQALKLSIGKFQFIQTFPSCTSCGSFLFAAALQNGSPIYGLKLNDAVRVGCSEG